MIDWISVVFAAAGLNLVQFGPVPELVKKKNPWYGFRSEDPILFVVRAESLETGDCTKWIKALIEDVPGNSIRTPEVEANWNSVWKEWEPWNSDDREAVTDCKKLPCQVKLNGSEISELKGLSAEDRFNKFKSLVVKRTIEYGKTQIRKEYEFPGDPQDPWALFEKQGFSMKGAKLPSKPEFWVRKLDFAPGKIRTIRQVLDRRVAKASSELEATVWLRDSYTDHYFDSWGEWTQVSCDRPPGKGITVVQGMALELDLLKKSDLISTMMRGKMKSAIEDNGYLYLDRAFVRMRIRATSQ